ncbi:hypothetical protein XA68_15097 [Ophiocordyceps unilateralis]|uniref:magnesium chelatase n=1 Tax=Ophiocordyceps unilateralis TaxID=268505 RepID=A0A2A9P7K7_OPHUN|nr:hypothetical protein XA68_15097 [Ophiocordyceps unilateralis]
MADDTRVQDLSDVELALLLCLVSREHGLLSAPTHACGLLVRELQLAALKTFGLRCVVVDCHPDMTLDHFASALLCPPSKPAAAPAVAGPSEPRPTQTDSFRTTPPPVDASSSSAFRPPPPQPDSLYQSDAQRHSWRAGSPISPVSSLQIANCVLARDLDRAPIAVQIQALELLRTRRIFTRTSVQAAPRQFVFLPVLQAAFAGDARVTPHLNDFLAIAHWHDPDQGFANLDDLDDDTNVGPAAISVDGLAFAPTPPLISEAEISRLAQFSQQQVEVDIEVLRYQMNIISFLRMHRAVAHGMTPAATKMMDKITRCLASIHGLDFVTPALVALATKKVYLHRIRLVSPDRERSLQWGSSLEAVEAVLADVGPEQVIQDVLDAVTAPL